MNLIKSSIVRNILSQEGFETLVEINNSCEQCTNVLNDLIIYEKIENKERISLQLKNILLWNFVREIVCQIHLKVRRGRETKKKIKPYTALI